MAKQPKRLSYQHKRYLSNNGYNPDEWMKQSEDNVCIVYIHKETKELLTRYK